MPVKIKETTVQETKTCSSVNAPVSVSSFSVLREKQHNHWRKLHTTRFTADQLELWIQSIPGCASCQRDFRRIVANHPPIFDNWERWTWIVHNVVNTKLGKQLIAWTDAISLWDWPIKDIPNGSTENTGKNTS